MDAWISRLKEAYDAGYYRTESAEGAQSPFPWQNKSCRDCPFWSSTVCQVHAEYRSPMAYTCGYFDPANHEEARALIRERQVQGMSNWWQWFNDHGATR